MDTEDLFVSRVAEKLATVPGVEAVALGGSRATGEHRPDSDFDFAIYYRGTLNPADIRALGWPGEVSEIGGWGGGVMNGGGWLTIEDRHVDVHYRDLSDIEHHLSEADAGRFQVERLPFYLAGIPTYVVVGELAVAKALKGSLPRPAYPEKLRDAASRWWHESAMLTLIYAEGAYVTQGDPIGVAGALARAVVEESHARLAAKGEWVLNEKRIVQRAGLNHVAVAFSGLTSHVNTLKNAVAQVREALGLPLS